MVTDPPTLVSSPSPEPQPAKRAAPRCRKVLVVDDNVSSAQSLELLLTLEGHKVQVVHDGSAVLRGG